MRSAIEGRQLRRPVRWLQLEGIEREGDERVQDAFFNHRGDDEALIAAVPDEVAREHAIFGTPDEVREQAARYEGIVDTSTFYCASSLMSPERIRENVELMIETFGR